MPQPLPSPLISVLAEIISRRETHASLDSLFMYAEAPGDPPDGSKTVKALDWLRRISKESADPLATAGRLVEHYMEDVSNSWNADYVEEDKKKLEAVFALTKLQYVTGGKLIGALGAPSATLEQLLKSFDFASINIEFERALKNVESSPREAVSAASNILESFCKVYIADNSDIQSPQKQDLKAVWAVVRKHLGFDPSKIEDNDLQTILTGLLAVVEGIGSLRTHASSAHGAGKAIYKLESRHARLAVHAAHTVTLFALETWQKRRVRKNDREAN